MKNNEKKETEGINSANLPTDLIADKNGVITSMITRKGVPMVSVGDTVKKGDLLVKESWRSWMISRGSIRLSVLCFGCRYFS